MQYKRIHVSELALNQSARRLDGTGKFDGTYVIRAGGSDLDSGAPFIYVYPITGAGSSWNVFKSAIDEIVEIEV